MKMIIIIKSEVHYDHKKLQHKAAFFPASIF